MISAFLVRWTWLLIWPIQAALLAVSQASKVLSLIVRTLSPEQLQIWPLALLEHKSWFLVLLGFEYWLRDLLFKGRLVRSIDVRKAQVLHQSRVIQINVQVYRINWIVVNCFRQFQIHWRDRLLLKIALSNLLMSYQRRLRSKIFSPFLCWMKGSCGCGSCHYYLLFSSWNVLDILLSDPINVISSHIYFKGKATTTCIKSLFWILHSIELEKRFALF